VFRSRSGASQRSKASASSSPPAASRRSSATTGRVRVRSSRSCRASSRRIRVRSGSTAGRWIFATRAPPASMGFTRCSRISGWSVASRSSRTCSCARRSASGRWACVLRFSIAKRCAAPLARLSVESLSGGQRQSVAIARAVREQARVVILDEPTAALGVAQAAQVLLLMERLRASGTAVLVVSHNLREVFAISDVVIVLRLGRVAQVFETKETDEEEVVGAIVGARTRVHA